MGKLDHHFGSSSFVFARTLLFLHRATCQQQKRSGKKWNCWNQNGGRAYPLLECTYYHDSSAITTVVQLQGFGSGGASVIVLMIS